MSRIFQSLAKNKLKILLASLLSLSNLGVEAASLISNEALSLSADKASISTSLSSEESVTELSKKAKVKVISSNKKLVKIKPAVVKFDTQSESLSSKSFRIFSSSRKLSKITEEETITLTVKPNKAAQKAGIEESTLSLTIVLL